MQVSCKTRKFKCPHQWEENHWAKPPPPAPQPVTSPSFSSPSSLRLLTLPLHSYFLPLSVEPRACTSWYQRSSTATMQDALRSDPDNQMEMCVVFCILFFFLHKSMCLNKEPLKIWWIYLLTNKLTRGSGLMQRDFSRNSWLKWCKSQCFCTVSTKANYLASM